MVGPVGPAGIGAPNPPGTGCAPKGLPGGGPNGCCCAVASVVIAKQKAAGSAVIAMSRIMGSAKRRFSSVRIDPRSANVRMGEERGPPTGPALLRVPFTIAPEKPERILQRLVRSDSCPC